MIEKRLLTSVFFSLFAFACQGGNGSGDDFAPSDGEVVIVEPPDDTAADPGVLNPPPTTNTRCESLCDSWARVGCPSMSNNCPAQCRGILEEDACGLETYELIACTFGAGICPPEDDEEPDPRLLENCSDALTNYTQCNNDSP